MSIYDLLKATDDELFLASSRVEIAQSVRGERLMIASNIDEKM